MNHPESTRQGYQRRRPRSYVRGAALAVLLGLLLVPQVASAQSIRIVGDGSVQSGGAFTVSGDFQGEKPDSVSLSLEPGGTSLGSAPVSKTGTWMMSATVPASTSPGDYQIRQEATGEDGKPIGGLGTASLRVTPRASPRPQQQAPAEPGLPADHFTPATGRDVPGPPYRQTRLREGTRSAGPSSRGPRATGGGESSSGGASNEPSTGGAPGSTRRDASGSAIPDRTPFEGRFRRAKPSSTLLGPEVPASLAGRQTAGPVRNEPMDTPWDLIALGALACLLILSVGTLAMWLLIRGRPDGPSDGGEPRDPPPDGPGPPDPLDVELQEMIAEERARRESLPRA